MEKMMELGKGKKQCQKCQKIVGARTLVCECGYEFKSKGLSSVQASSQIMGKDISIEIKKSLSDTKQVVSQVESRKAKKPTYSTFSDEKKPVPTQVSADESIVPLKIFDETKRYRITYVPSGECPVKPFGFKDKKWSNGQASPEVIKNWAVQVYNAAPDGQKYAPHAVAYWAQDFWEWDSKHFKEIRSLIIEALSPEQIGLNSDEYDDV
jgi:hypothetical protein